MYLLKKQQALPNFKPIPVGHLGAARYTTPLPHITTPPLILKAGNKDLDQPALCCPQIA